MLIGKKKAFGLYSILFNKSCEAIFGEQFSELECGIV